MGDVGDDADPAPATLPELRQHIRELATVDGDFVVACARTGESPVPVDGYRFPDRETAAEAAAYTTEYRDRLREMDPRTPRYDPVAHEAIAGDGSLIDEPLVDAGRRAGTSARDWRRPVDREGCKSGDTGQ